MKTKIIIILLFCSMCFATWDNDLPADSSVWNDAAGYIRDNWDALETILGTDLAVAHPIYQATEPDKKPDGSTALAASDLGLLWIDSDDNLIYVLTNQVGPTWTSTANLTGITSADPEFTLTNTDVEDSDFGRQSRFVAMGTQSGSETSILGYIDFSHDGTSDDEKGQFKILLNAGSDTNTPANQPIGYTADGKIDVSASLSVLDEDDLTSDGDKVVPTQQSVKAYVDNQIAASPTVTGDSDSSTDSPVTIGTFKLVWGKVGSTTVGTVNISHGLTKCFTAWTQCNDTSTGDKFAAHVTSIGDTTFTVRITNSTWTNWTWFAIGR